MTMLLFSSAYTFLGEIEYASQGSVDQCVLSAEGEQAYGDVIHRWRLEGVSAGMNRVLLRSPEAKWAISRWAQMAGVIIVELPERLLPYWHRLSNLDLEPEERYVSLQAMRHAPFRMLSAWDQALQQLATSSAA